MRERLADWRGLLRREADAGKLALRALLTGPLVFTPKEDATGRYYEFSGEGTVDRLRRFREVLAFSRSVAPGDGRTRSGRVIARSRRSGTAGAR